MSPTRQTAALLRPYLGRFALSLLCMVGLSLTTGAVGYLAGPVVTFLFDPGKVHLFSSAWMAERIPLSKERLGALLPWIIVSVALLQGVFYYGQNYLLGYVGNRITMDLRNRTYEHLQRLSMGFYTRSSTGELTSRITNDISIVQNALTNAAEALLKDGLTVIVLTGTAFLLDWKLALMGGIVFPVVVVPIVKFGKKMRHVSTHWQEIFARMMTHLNETLSGVRIVKAFGMEAYETRRFAGFTRDLFNEVMRAVRVRSLSYPLMAVLTALGLAGTLWYARHRIEVGDLHPEQFFSFFTTLFLLYQPIKGLSGTSNNIQEGVAAARRVFDLLAEPVEIQDTPGALDLTGVQESLEFDRVSFRYGSRWDLKDISFKIRGGETLAVVGMSGAGKTTLANLIPRFYEPAEGAIRIDGRDLRQWRLGSLRRQIGIVTQQIILFNDTVRANIAYGDPTRTRTEIEEAARLAYAHDFITALPHGYETPIGEAGVRLSGGERQRIAIARAFLKNAPILILDEATSSLDVQSETEVQKALEVLMRGRLSLVIAHRLSTIRDADRILVLAGGRCVEEGTHDALMARPNGEYRRLYETQQRAFETTLEGA